MSARGSGSSGLAPPLVPLPAASASASASAAASRVASALPRSARDPLKLPQIKNAEDAKFLEDERKAKEEARKKKAALTPAEKRALKLRQEQAREEAEAAKKLKDTKLAEVRAGRGSSASHQPSAAASAVGSPLATGRGGETSRRQTNSIGAGDMQMVENPDGTFSPAGQGGDAAQDDEDEAMAAAAAEADKPPEENYDVVFDGPKSPLIMATANRDMEEMMRLLQEVPIEYRVEFVNAYDDHGCSAIFFSVGPDHSDCMQLLLDYGADPNHQNNKKNGPLHIACAIQNKKAMKVLIEHGANILLENWQYQKPHEMVPERDKVSPTQAYLNLMVEAFQEKVANKEIYGNITRHQRSYYRSIFDIADSKHLGVLKYEVVAPLLDTCTPDGGLSKADPHWVHQFFSGWDMDKNGVISFAEFLHRVVTVQNEKLKLKKKLMKKQAAAAKRKKKKEDAAKPPSAAAAAPAAAD